LEKYEEKKLASGTLDYGDLNKIALWYLDVYGTQELNDTLVVQVQTCWTIGQYIVEFEQGGAVRAAYGKRLLVDLAASLTAEFGRF
jgi:hypothetical protein